MLLLLLEIRVRHWPETRRRVDGTRGLGGKRSSREVERRREWHSFSTSFHAFKFLPIDGFEDSKSETFRVLK